MVRRATKDERRQKERRKTEKPPKTYKNRKAPTRKKSKQERRERCERAGTNDGNFLMRFPAEIRNRIFRPFLVHPNDPPRTAPLCVQREWNVIRVSSTEIRALNVRQAWAAQPAITRVCRAIRRETLPVYYGANVFAVEIPMTRVTCVLVHGEILWGKGFALELKDASKWLRDIGPSNRELLRQLHVRVVQEFGDCEILDRGLVARRAYAVLEKAGLEVPEGSVRTFVRTNNPKYFMTREWHEIRDRHDFGEPLGPYPHLLGGKYKYRSALLTDSDEEDDDS